MTTERIKEIQLQTAYPDSVSVKQALLQVWNECQQEYASQLKAEIERRQSLILSEPNGIVRETMIQNLLIDL